MTVNRGLFVKQIGNIGTTPLEARRALAGLFVENSPGTPRSGILEPASPSLVTGSANMSYNVGACTAVIHRAATEGVYVFSLHGTTNIPTTAAPGTDSRWDLIWIKQNDPEKSDTLSAALSNDGVCGVVQGTVATVPAKPTSGVPAGAMVIAEALVQAGATATNGASVTITQTWPYTGFRGVPTWVRNATERNAITGHIHQRVFNLSTGYQEAWNGSSWVSDQEQVKLQYAYISGAQTSVPSGLVWGPGMPQAELGRSVNPGFCGFTTNDWLEVFEEGVYTIDFMVEVFGGFGPGGFIAIEDFAGNTIASNGGSQPSPGPGGLSTSVTKWLKPGTTNPAGVVKVKFLQNSGSPKNANSFIHVAKIA